MKKTANATAREFAGVGTAFGVRSCPTGVPLRRGARFPFVP